MKKKKDAMAAEPEVVYGQGRGIQGCLMQYIVPKKDRSFLEDMAKVRGWKSVENQEKIEKPMQKKPAKRSTHLDASLRQIENGEYFEASSAEEMCEQIFGKSRRTKHVPNACTLKAMKDAREGRVFHAKSSKDLMKQMESEPKVGALRVAGRAKPTTKKPAKRLSGLDKAIQEVERGEVWEYASVDDMFDQILGKGWRTK